MLPAFSALASQAAVSAEVQAGKNTYQLEVRLLPGVNSNFLKANPYFQSSALMFPGNSDPELSAVYLVQSKISASQFTSLYGSEIVYAQPDMQMETGAVYVNDPGFTSVSTDTDHQWGLVKANFLNAWSMTTGSPSVVVGVLDTGIDGQHEDLSDGQVVAGFNFLNNTIIPAGADSDNNGHGTLVAGVIGATANNFRGIAGTNWNVSMMPLKALDSTGAGNSTNVAEAIVYAADHGVNVLNMSLGGQGFSDDTTMANAISYAYNKGVVLVAAAGNDVSTDGGDMDLDPVFPVCDDNGQNMIIGVAATDDNDLKASFSNYGHSCVDVSAPGVRILSTINIDPGTGQILSNGYAYASGTSLATPFVSGEAALIKASYPKATNQEIYYRIITSANPIDNMNTTQCGGTSCAGMLGSGRIDAYDALQPNLVPESLADNTVVHAQNSSINYYISGGVKEQISSFVMQQRFSNVTSVTVPEYVLETLPIGPFASPLDGTIVKVSGNPTVYEISGGIKRPLTSQIFSQRKIKASDINIVADDELSSWITGTFMPPLEGTLVKTPSNPTVYWVVNGLLHPINRNFWIERGLNIFPFINISKQDIKGYAQGDPYVS